MKGGRKGKEGQGSNGRAGQGREGQGGQGERHYYYQSGLHRFHIPLPHQLLLSASAAAARSSARSAALVLGPTHPFFCADRQKTALGVPGGERGRERERKISSSTSFPFIQQLS